MALCTNDGIRFIVNTKEPYTGAIYAAEKFSTCSQVVENAKQISITFPPPNVSPNCGTTIKVSICSFICANSPPLQRMASWKRWWLCRWTG